MKTITNTTKQHKQSRAAAHAVAQQKKDEKGIPGFTENRPGPGNNDKNLVPTTHAVNTGSTWKSFETDLKSHWDDDEWIWCKTYVTYDTSYPDGFPKTITGYSQWYDDDANAWKNMAKSGTSLSISAPSFGGGVKTRTLDEMTAETWSLLLGVGKGTNAVKYLNNLSSSFSDFNDLWTAIYAENAPEDMDQFEGAIDAATKGTHPKVNLVIDY